MALASTLLLGLGAALPRVASAQGPTRPAPPPPAALSPAAAAAPATQANAATAPDPERAAMIAAEKEFLEARRTYLQGRPRAACKRFAASQAKYPTAATLLNVGNCYEEGHLRGGLLAALRAFERALVDVDRIQDAAAQTHVREEAQRRLDKLKARVPRLVVRASPTAGSRVFLDGTRFRRFEQRVLINPGKHRLDVLGGDCKVHAQSFELAEGQSLEVPLPALQQCRFGQLPYWLGAAGGALGVAWILTASKAYTANSDYSALVDRCSLEPCDGPTRQRMSDRREEARANAAIVDYVLSPATVLLLGTAATLWWLDRDPPTTSESSGAVRFTPVSAACSSMGCLLSAGGAF